MVIAVYSLEPQYFNLALEKIRKYHEDQGETVDQYKALWHDKYDKIYCSSIFTYTNKSTVTPDMICGGTGFDLTTTLLPKIERVKVKKNIGFTTRGCIRNCPFCVVPQKEGSIRRVGDLYDLWDRKSRNIILYDNNILALPNHFSMIVDQAQKNRLIVDLNQGLDIRLVDKKMAYLISVLPTGRYWRFSWDFMEDEKKFERGLKHLTKYITPSRLMFYVLVNFNTTIEEDLYRINKIQSNGCDDFVMVYDKPNASRLIKELARWNNRFYFRGRTFKEYLQARKLSYLYEETLCVW